MSSAPASSATPATRADTSPARSRLSVLWRHPIPDGDSGGHRHARSVHAGCLALALITAVILVRVELSGNREQALPLMAVEVVVLAALALNYVGRWIWAVRLAAFGILLGSVFIVSQARDGFRSIVMLSFPGLLMVAVMLLGAADYWLLASATLLTVTGLGVAEIHGLIPTVPITRSPTDYSTVLIVDLMLGVIAFFGGLLARSTRLNLEETRATVEQLAAANRRLKRSEARYRSFIELAVDAVIVVDQDGKISEVNHQASVLTGVARDELSGVSIASVLSPIDPEHGRFPLDLLADGASIMRAFRVVRPDGTVVETEMHSAVLPDGLILCFCRDITERRRAAEEREKLQAQLQQAQKMESIGRLAGGVAHDFNNLLTVINGYCDVLLSNPGPGTPPAELAEIQKAGKRAAELTRQLLAFSRKQVLQPRVLDLNRVVADMRPMLERLVGEDVQVSVEFEAPTATVCADPHQLGQVVMNLAVNARDAMPGGGALAIRTACVDLDEGQALSNLDVPAGRYVTLAVSDSGVGMDEETRRHIFEPFFTTKGAGRGTGLGLSMVQGIVAQSGGSVSVSSARGRGTTFTVYLPAVAEAATEIVASVPLPDRGGRETVLVVEDQPDVRSYTVAVLKARGYVVLEAGSAAEALQLCQQERRRIHLVVTDVVMPSTSGVVLAGRLKEILPGIKVLFMSGYADTVVARQGELGEGTAFVQKPFSPTELAEKVRFVLGPPD
jgi:two-component system, cell cycle sensor histidine kinase and response regulator CckA